MKFRENSDWTTNWGAADFPSGTGTSNGPNIPLTAGTYDVSFNSSTFEYDFAANATATGEISLVGTFNEFGAAGPDIYLIRDAAVPSYYTLTYNFSSSTDVLFRMNGAEFTVGSDSIWGWYIPSRTRCEGYH